MSAHSKNQNNYLRMYENTLQKNNVRLPLP